MREVKFRVWIESERRFFYFTLHDLVCEHGLIDESLIGGVEQFAGLCDKNRREIYERDIVEDESGSRGVVEWFNKLSYDSGGAVHSGFYCKKWLDGITEDSDISWHYGFDKNIEIIGNIHENPELLS